MSKETWHHDDIVHHDILISRFSRREIMRTVFPHDCQDRFWWSPHSSEETWHHDNLVHRDIYWFRASHGVRRRVRSSCSQNGNVLAMGRTIFRTIIKIVFWRFLRRSKETCHHDDIVHLGIDWFLVSHGVRWHVHSSSTQMERSCNETHDFPNDYQDRILAVSPHV